MARRNAKAIYENHMKTENKTQSSNAESFERRQKRLVIFAWCATLLPLVAFAYLTWQSAKITQMNEDIQIGYEKKVKQVQALENQKAGIEADILKLKQELEAQRESTKHYRNFAGVKIRFYRESDRALVETALTRLGYNIDATLGTSKLIDMKPNTIAYGTLVSDQDLRDIAIALVEAGFPLKRIAPATRQPDPKLIQIYASAESENHCGLLNKALIEAGDTCGPK